MHLLRLHRDAGQAADLPGRIGKLDKDAIGGRLQRDGVARDGEYGKVGVALAALTAATVAAGRFWQAPLNGTVWHTDSVSGRAVGPVLALTTTVVPLPTLSVAIANAAEPLLPLMRRIPSLPGAAASATISGGCVDAAESSRLLTPLIVAAPSTFAQSNPSATLIGMNGALALNAITEDCDPPAVSATRVLAVPVTALVFGFVV